MQSQVDHGPREGRQSLPKMAGGRQNGVSSISCPKTELSSDLWGQQTFFCKEPDGEHF